MNLQVDPIALGEVSAAAAVFAVLVSVISLGVTYKLTVKAQRKAFVDALHDRARIEVTSAIRSYQSWLVELSVAVRDADMAVEMEEKGWPKDWREKWMEVRALIDSFNERRRWGAALEDYELLFPYTRGVRIALVMRDRDIISFATRFATELLLASTDSTSAGHRMLVERAHVGRELVDDQTALLDDIRVYVQNKALSEIMESSVPARAPRDAHVPRIIAGADEMLIIASGVEAHAHASR